MSKNPVLIPQPFANNGSKNSIQNTRQAGQDPEDATWSDGFPNVTMQPIESGGLPPKGMDFNGILNALSASIVHQQKGGFFYFDQNHAETIGGYSAGAILIADDNSRLFISTINENRNNPNQNSTGWEILAGNGLNSDTATKLKKPIYINCIQFDGSTDINATPAGAVQFFAMSTAPVGWLKANGAEVSRTTYANLFAAIGTTFGIGDGSTTFTLPDLRGEFLRGLDDGRGLDSGRVIGSFQNDMLASHNHSFGHYKSVNAGIGNEIKGGAELSTVGVGSEILGGSAGGNETRPRNVALLACIKI